MQGESDYFEGVAGIRIKVLRYPEGISMSLWSLDRLEAGAQIWLDTAPMKSYPRLGSAILLTFSCLGVGLGAEPNTTEKRHPAISLNQKAVEELNRAMKEEVAAEQVSGLIGLIGWKGKIGYFESHGQRDLDKADPMSKESLLRIYSMTKPIVAVTAMALWEEGKFKLDDPIHEYLPEWKTVSVREGQKLVAAKSPVTPRQLMTHSSGLTYDRSDLAMGSRDSLQDFSKSMAKRPLVFHPGESYAYGYSIDILGRYLEAIEGKTLDLIMRERVFDKLKMSDTEFWVKNSEDRSRVALVYSRKNNGGLRKVMGRSEVMIRPVRMMGGQGLMSTAGDYAKFCEMLLGKGELNGQRILKEETVNLMFKNHLKDIGKSYGLGGRVNELGRYEWGGAAGTRFWVDCGKGHYAVFMIQNWGSKPKTWDIFRKHAEAALAK